MKRFIAVGAVLGAMTLSACGAQCGPGTQEFNGTCVSNNQGGFGNGDRDDDDFEYEDD